jgi:tyrosine ammonia-lyase
VLTLNASLDLADFEALARGEVGLVLGPEPRGRLSRALAQMRRLIEENRVVYGVTTGFGALADRFLAARDSGALQRKLVYHLATGVGPHFSFVHARAVLAARLLSLSQGYSGVSEQAVDLIVRVLNSGFAPAIPEQGTVGASGDLTPLAHAALALIGEGAFVDRTGRRVDSARVFQELGAPPLSLSGRDGLALVNGVSAMTGVAALNGALARRLFRWSARLTVAAAELLGGRTEAWRPEFAQARPHPGLALASAWLRADAEGSARVRRSLAAEGRHPGEGLFAAPQDAYSLRCAPQVIGAALDVLDHHDAVVLRELRSASDNPILIEEEPYALHGGNFLGGHVALVSDSLRNAVATVAALVERQLARLTNEKLNEGLPPFLARGTPGLDSGFMGAQVTATALLAEMRAYAPASVQSIPTNADNQDVVSLGTIAARSCADALEDASHILAISALATAQGMELIGLEQFGLAARALHAEVRDCSAPLLEDRPLSRDILALAERMRACGPDGV